MPSSLHTDESDERVRPRAVGITVLLVRLHQVLSSLRRVGLLVHTGIWCGRVRGLPR